jgi:cell division protein FtsA
VKFGSAWPGENRDNEIVSIPGLRGREPKEISLKTCQNNSRTCGWNRGAGFTEIKAYGHEDPQEINCIVFTGGGAQLKHIKQLVEYITGMDTRMDIQTSI